MNTSPLNLSLAAALVAALALAGCNRKAEDTPAQAPQVTAPDAPPSVQTPVAEQPSSLNVTAVTLGTTAGADGRVASPVTTFTTSDPIVVSVDTSGAATNTEIVARLVYEDGQTAGEQTEMVTSAGNQTTNVTFTNANGWPTGNYRAEILIGGTQTQSRDFSVR
ncbi:MAG: hypothetical protein M3Q11_07525 [Pseudomonadota bacterium]|nr:hypothetical protein [Pseudomonadota bacterium]